MKQLETYLSGKTRFLLLLLSFVFVSMESFAFQPSDIKFVEYKGEVVNARNGKPISSAYLALNNSNISTITNADGQFSLKVPEDLTDATVTVSVLGFQSKTLPLDYFKSSNTVIELEETVQELTEVSLYKATNPNLLVKEMLSKKDENYLTDQSLMTSFYRETIKKGWNNVSLSEAVVKISKSPYNSPKRDLVSLYKARKSTDYDRLDTLALKLRGGPFNTLYLDMMKYTEYVLRPEMIDSYKFEFDDPTKINDRYTYVVNFEESDKSDPWYYGKLFIDAETSTLVKADYSLNVDDRDAAAAMFVKKKPNGAKVYPTELNYQVDYAQDNGKWHYAYGKAQMDYVVNWKRKIFNSKYKINSEMVVTDYQEYVSDDWKKSADLIRPNIVMVDDVSGFYDSDFWGSNNIIEPEKSIQNAIDKIKRKIEE
ncbi:carboxypeptidase-like regulatory domain-containing protein [Christiangramia sabulilitoris]|uniref:Carboxypeptidase-like regulatory domain-containing protein n=1 Tax=Christiangramia sabulilitoris TaxID=2583991 RepID=A0A550I704_9FLAO|nr:carboxypeptidase-like regulatory domain-containing protein [Christiangramia sabulilitoris]TRO66588.1 carboxypeptidase-like regulatory domain-containing protein [Christiangramia sabulilitoris]